MCSLSQREIALINMCVEDYEEEMGAREFLTVTELVQFHQITKDKILLQLPNKIRNVLGTTQSSLNIRANATNKIEGVYTRFKAHFEKSHLRQQDKLIVEQALRTYHEHMEKSLDSSSGCTMDKVKSAHTDASAAATKFFKSSPNARLATLNILKDQLENSFREYQSRVQMSEKSKDDPAIGIDLGTTMCCAAVYYDGKVEIIENRNQGNSKTTPSYVAYDEDEECDTFGSVAKEDSYKYPETTIYDAKRMIGRPWSDFHLQNDRKHLPFEVVNENGHPKIKTWNVTRYPHEVSARLLTQFRFMADDHLDMPPGTVSKAVITVPAYFTERQRRATAEAGECAGLDVLNILSEPTAAAIAYSWERKRKQEKKNALIYDLGGGTFDVSVAVVEEKSVEILAVDGDTHLGGRDIDQLLMDYCVQEFMKKERVDLLQGKDSNIKQTRDGVKSALARLKLQCEIAKNRLSSAKKQTISVERIHNDKHLNVPITREKFDELIRPLVQKTLDIVDHVMKEVVSKGIQGKMDIHDVILVGGSTRIPLIAQMVTDHFDGKKPCKSINPDEAVAYGAAVQAAILNHDDRIAHIKVQDVTPMTLGTDVGVDGVSKLIPRNSKIPCEVTKEYCFVNDYQTSMRFTIFQGESEKASENNLLGEFLLEGFAAKPAGEEDAIATMKIDRNGLLHVTAVSRSTGNAQGITISSDRVAISEEEKAKIRKDMQTLALQHT